MNKHTMLDPLEIVNNRVLKMLDSGEVNREIFYRDVRTLAELIKGRLENGKKEGRA